VNEETSGTSHSGEFMSDIIIPPSNPPTCQVEIEGPGKEYEAVIWSVGNKFEALFNGLQSLGEKQRKKYKSLIEQFYKKHT
jgi:hypothetical protein